MEGLNEQELQTRLDKLINRADYLTANAETKTAMLYDLVGKGSVDAAGDVTILYSGKIDGVSSEDLAKSAKNARIINNTASGKFLASKEFTLAYAKIFDPSISLEYLDDFWNAPNDSPMGQHRAALFDGKNGAWAKTSKRFVEATTGEVKIITSLDARSGNVFELTEYDALKGNDKITKVNGFSKKDFDKLDTKFILADSYFKLLGKTDNANISTIDINAFVHSDINKIDPQKLDLIYERTKNNGRYKEFFDDIYSKTSGHTGAFFKRLGIAGSVMGFFTLMSTAGAKEANGDRVGAIQEVQDFLDEMSGEAIAGAIAGYAVGALLAKITVGGVAIAASSPFWAGAAILVTAVAAGYAGSKYIGLIAKPVRDWISSQPEFVKGMDWLYNISGVEQIVEKNGKTYFLFSYLNNTGDRQKNFKEFSALMKGFGSEYIIDNLYKLIFNETPSNFENSYIKINNFL